MNEERILQLKNRQAELDDEFQVERKRNEELLDQLQNEKNKTEDSLEDLYGRHKYYIGKLNDSYDDNSFNRNLDGIKYDLDSAIQRVELQTNDYIEDCENDYRKQQNDIYEKLLEK